MPADLLIAEPRLNVKLKSGKTERCVSNYVRRFGAPHERVLSVLRWIREMIGRNIGAVLERSAQVGWCLV